MKISIVIPVMNEAGNIELLFGRIIDVVSSLPQHEYEIVFVDDGSTDDTLLNIKRIHASQKEQTFVCVRCVSFSRNFGHQKALKAGLDVSTGDCVICLDGDLQHPPELIPTLIKTYESEQCDIVYTIREKDPKLSFFKNFTSSAFYKLLNNMSNLNLEEGSADFRLISRKVCDVLKNLPEQSIFFRGMINWVGFSKIGIPYKPEKREWGKSKYSVKKMFQFALSGITSFSEKPLQASFGAAIFFLFAGIFFVVVDFVKFFHDEKFFLLLVFAFMSLIASIILMAIGVIGIYLGNLFFEVKKRPAYIIKEQF